MSSFQVLRYAIRGLLPGRLRGRLRSVRWVRRAFLSDMEGKKSEESSPPP
jgi:hypothetical protein